MIRDRVVDVLPGWTRDVLVLIPVLLVALMLSTTASAHVILRAGCV